MSSASRVVLLLWRCGRAIHPRQHASLCSIMSPNTWPSRSIHQTSFVGDTSKTKRDVPQLKSSHEATAAGGSTYSALMDSAKTKPRLSSREQFGLVLKEFMAREKYRRGHVTFINMAMERMEEFGLEKDLLTYNRLLDLLPKGRYHPKRMLDALWPRPLPQTELVLELLTRMEDNGVWPDAVTYSLLVEVFGRRSLPVEKCERMLYWFERYKDADLYWIDGDLPEEMLEMSKLALRRIVNSDGSITEHEIMSAATDQSSEFILSGHTATQLKLLHKLSSSLPACSTSSWSPLLYVEGPHRIWINKTTVYYFSLRLSANDSRQLANNSEGAVLAVCMCQPPVQDTLRQWMKELQLTYPCFTDATVVYSIKIDTANQRTALLDNSIVGTLEDPSRT